MKHTFIIQKSSDGSISGVNLLIKHIEGHSGYKFRVEVEQYRAKRSDQQNRFFWAVCTILSKELGYTKDEVADIVKFKFLKRSKVDEATGELFEYLGSTSKLNKMEFVDFTQDIIQWAAQTFNIVIPQPNEQLTIN